MPARHVDTTRTCHVDNTPACHVDTTPACHVDTTPACPWTPRPLATWKPRLLATWTPSPGRLQRLSLPLDSSRGGALDYSWTLDEVDEQRRRHRERAVRVGMRCLAMFNM